MSREQSPEGNERDARQPDDNGLEEMRTEMRQMTAVFGETIRGLQTLAEVAQQQRAGAETAQEAAAAEEAAEEAMKAAAATSESADPAKAGTSRSKDRSGSRSRKRTKAVHKGSGKNRKKRSRSRSTQSSSTNTEDSSSSDESDTSDSSRSDSSESEGSPKKKKARKSRKISKEERERKANRWPKIKCKKVSEWTWKDPEGINAMRYGALYDHLAGLCKFQKDHVPKDAGRKAYRKLFRGVRREMNVIRIGETAINKWKTVAEMRKKLGRGSRKLEKAAQEADKRINERNAAQAATKLVTQQQQQPFHSGAGGNVAPAQQLRGRGRQVAPNISRGQGNAQQGQGRNNIQCFRCQQWGHFKSQCPQIAVKLE